MAGLTLRRLRDHPRLRHALHEVRPDPAQFVQPLFVVEGLREREAVPGLREVWRDTPGSLIRQVEQDLEAGVGAFLLFGVPARKHERNFEHDFTAAQIESIKARFGNALWLAADVCLCSHTTHGHCGILDHEHAHVRNEESVAALVDEALRFAAAGADAVAPSDMMDGRVAAIRDALDAGGRERTVLLSYAAKFHSAFYGPFRVAADSAPKASGGDIALRDRASYQIDPARPRDALQSAFRDAAEGADILMVKPGLPYLDVLAALSAEISLPWAVYQTSGEQAGLDLAADAGLADAARAQVETWTAFVRAGANLIISYAARRAGEYLRTQP